MKIIQNFGSISGLRLNITKSQAVWLGKKAGSSDKLCDELNISWNQESFKLLGIKFSTNLKEMIDTNYRDKINSIKKLLGSWVKRNLSPIGKITVLKSLAIPKLIHLFSSLPNPSKKIIAEIESVFYQFIWNFKRDKIKRKTLIGSIENGGLNMIELTSFINYLKIKWIKRTLDNPNGNWQLFTLKIFGIDGDLETIWDLGYGKLNKLKSLITNDFLEKRYRSLITHKK